MKKIPTMPEQIDMKNCPFCGGEGMIGAKYRYHHPIHFFVVCRKCGAMAKDEKTREEAAKKWNRRADNDKRTA